jgi:hypothetical protein
MEWTPGITSKLASSGTMHIESERLKTYDHRWPFNSSANLSPAAMAAAGLFFDPHPKTPDRAICFSCKNALSNWDINDHPMEEHKRWYKSCAFVTGASKNVPILSADRARIGTLAPSAASAPTFLVAAPAAADKCARAATTSINEAPKPPPLNSYLQSLGAPITVESAAPQVSSAAVASQAEIVYSISSSVPSPSRLLDDSFWTSPSLSNASSDTTNGTAASVSGKPASSLNSALKPSTVVSKQSTFVDEEEDLVVQHNSRRLKKKSSARGSVIEPSCSDPPQADTAALPSIAKPPIANCERHGHSDAATKAAVQHRIFNLASACAETASARADLDALRTSVNDTLGVVQQQLPTFALTQLDNFIAQPLMKGLARLERASANIKNVQLSLSSRHAAQIEALRDVSVQVERRKSDLNVRPPFSLTVASLLWLRIS